VPFTTGHDKGVPSVRATTPTTSSCEVRLCGPSLIGWVVSGNRPLALEPNNDFHTTFKSVRSSQVFSQEWQLVALPGNAVGVWFDRKGGTNHLDVSVVRNGKHEAIKLGKTHNQIPTSHEKTEKEVPTGGTAKTHSDTARSESLRRRIGKGSQKPVLVTETTRKTAADPPGIVHALCRLLSSSQSLPLL